MYVEKHKFFHASKGRGHQFRPAKNSWLARQSHHQSTRRTTHMSRGIYSKDAKPYYHNAVAEYI